MCSFKCLTLLYKRMNKLIAAFIYMIFLQPSFSQYNPASYPVYAGIDLGLTYHPTKSIFKIWSPPATAAELRFYENSTTTTVTQTVAMEKSTEGTWIANATGNHKGMFYTFRVMINGSWSDEVV